MHMQVIHCLATIFAGVHNDPVAPIEVLTTRELRCSGHQMTKQSSILGKTLCQRSNMLLGNDQHMRGRLWIDVGKNNAAFILDRKSVV